MKWILAALLLMAFVCFVCLRANAEGRRAWAHLLEDEDDE